MSEPTPQFPPPVINYASPGMAPSPKSFGRGIFGWILFIGLAVMLFFVLSSKKSSAQDISLSEFSTQLAKGNVSVVIVDNEILRGKFTKPMNMSGTNVNLLSFRTEVPQGSSQSWMFTQWLLEHREGAEVRIENNQNLLVNLLLPLVPWVLIFGFIWFFVFRQLRKSSTQGTSPKPIPVYITTPEPK